MRVGEIVDRAASLWGKLPAVHDDWGTLSFSELHEQVERLAEKLRTSGLAQQMGLGLMTGNDRRFLIGLFAGLKCGAIVMPIAPRIKTREILEAVDQSGIHFILNADSPPANEGPSGVIDAPVELFRITRTSVALGRAMAPHIPDAAVVRFTSGTTGNAKGVVISHQSVMERIAATNRALRLGPADTVLWVLPMAYHFIVSIILYVFCGAAIAVANDRDTAKTIALSNRCRATLLYCSPMHIELLTADRSAVPLSTLQRVFSTTAGISLDACRRFKSRHALDVCQAFGIIEVGLPIINERYAALYPDAIGVALDDYVVEILDRTLTIVGPGTVGQLAIKGPGMFDGYLAPRLSRDQVLQDGWFLTGDLATKSADGVVKIAGREKFVINVAGNKVFPEEVEHVLLEHPLVSRCRVSGKAHTLIGEYVVAEVQCKPGERTNVAELFAWCRNRLSVHKVPRVIEIVDSIGLTPSGKVARV